VDRVPGYGGGLDCEDLTRLSLPAATVTSAQPVAAGAFVPAGRRGARGNAASINTRSCGVLPRVADGAAEQRFRHQGRRVAAGERVEREVRSVGQGGWPARSRMRCSHRRVGGYATAGTTPPRRQQRQLHARASEKLVNFAYRAVHEMAVNGKAVVNAYYEARPQRSYFNGCSGGGRPRHHERAALSSDFDASSPAPRRGTRSGWMPRGIAVTGSSTLVHERHSGVEYPSFTRPCWQACDGSTA